MKQGKVSSSYAKSAAPMPNVYLYKKNDVDLWVSAINYHGPTLRYHKAKKFRNGNGTYESLFEYSDENNSWAQLFSRTLKFGMEDMCINACMIGDSIIQSSKFSSESSIRLVNMKNGKVTSLPWIHCKTRFPGSNTSYTLTSIQQNKLI